MILGERVALRPMEPADAPAQHRWFNDAEVTRWTGFRYPTSLAAIEARMPETVEFANPRFSVERRDTGELVGYVALRDVTPETRNGELDLLLVARDLTTDTAATICRWAFTAIGLHRVHVWAFADDPAVPAFEDAGFVREGVARDRVFKNGRFHDCVLMARLA